MLRLLKLTVYNFGPFKEETVINFPEDNGVAIVYGENMRGKTSLLNAIRYALFGKIIGRGSRTIELHKMSNRENVHEGVYGFKITLDFQFEGVRYELIRQYRVQDGVETPNSDYDYIEDTFLRREGSLLSTGERDAELARIMPEQVSRFFLFDGELLQEYEELLSNESDMGRRIKESIERILGVPVLTNTRAHLTEHFVAAQKAESKAAQRDQKTHELGVLLAQQTDIRSHHDKEITRLKGELDGLRSRKSGVEEQLRKVERIENLLKERDMVESNRTNTADKINEKEKRLKELMSSIWRGLLNKRISPLRTSIQQQINEIKDLQTRRAVADEMYQRTMKAIEDRSCPVCLRDLDDSTIRRLKELSDLGEQKDIDETKLQQLMVLDSRLGSFQSSVNTELIEMLMDDIDNLTIDQAHYRDRISEINQQIGDIEEQGIRTQRLDYDKLIKEILIVEEAIVSETNALDKSNATIKKLQNELDKAGGVDFVKERRRRETYEKLYDLISEGVEVYRDRLRGKVEEDASKLFVNLTSEPEYTHLNINENYGLTIVHKDGEEVAVRSAGAEHVVALSLMGALQKNAPLRGPIIMDSPFGRLDETHTRNIVKALPIMAEQVMLLVYESELQPNMARNILQGRLREEYRLERVSGRHTRIKRM